MSIYEGGVPQQITMSPFMLTFRHNWPPDARKLDKRCAHRADGAPGSARSRFRRSERLCGQGQDRTVDLPLFRVNRAKRCANLPKRTSLISGTALGGRCSVYANRVRYARSTTKYSEGYIPSDDDAVTLLALSGEAIHLTRLAAPSAAGRARGGLLALMPLTDARPARTHRAGRCKPGPAGTGSRSMRAPPWLPPPSPRGSTGLCQPQAAIAAVHDEAETMDDTA